MEGKLYRKTLEAYSDKILDFKVNGFQERNPNLNIEKIEYSHKIEQGKSIAYLEYTCLGRDN